MSSIIVYIEEYDRNNYDASCFVEQKDGQWYVHIERVQQNTLVFPNKEKMLNFLSLFFDLKNGHFDTYVYIVNRDEVLDLHSLNQERELFGYDDDNLNIKRLKKYVSLCETQVVE